LFETNVLQQNLISQGDISDKGFYPEGPQYGNIFEADEKTLQNILTYGQIR
jgi:hypothetical protein